MLKLNNKIYFIFAIMFFVVFDMISTMCALSYLGSYEYEASNIIRHILENYGILGFMLVKCIVGFIVLWIAYKLKYDYILNGCIFVGLFVGISNFKIMFTGTSLWVFGINSQIISISMLMSFCLIQIILSVFRPNKVVTKKQI